MSCTFKHKEVSTFPKHHVQVSIQIIATTFTSIMLAFGCIFKMLYAIAGNYANVSSLDLPGNALITISISLFIIEAICYAKKKK